MAWGAFDQHDVLFLLGPAGCGKALTMTSKLFTRTGPVEMREACIGLEIANPDGGYSKIVGVFPQGKKQVCRVHFSDETYVDCCEEHLWSVSHADNGWKDKVVDTKYLEANCRRADGKRVLSIRATKPVNFERKEYQIPPYLLGLLLSEGNLTNSNVVFTTCEDEILGRASSLLTAGYTCKSKGIDHRIVKIKRSSAKNHYKDALKEYDLWGKKSYEKFIPLKYQYGSVDQRVALLQGLMDGDGGVEKTGAITYCTTSYHLAEDFCHLVHSLGGTTRIRRKEGSLKEDGTRHRISFRCYVNLPPEIETFFLGRKARLVKVRYKYKPKRYVSRVERLGEEEMQCISVDHEDLLYLTDNYTVTHNTHLACAFAISEILAKRKKKCVLTRPIVEAGEALGFLPGTFDEKVGPYMMPMYDCIQKCVGIEGPQKDIIDRSIEVAPIAYMRGRSQPLDSKVLTPTGYVLMGDIQVGDKVVGKDGKPTEVLGVYPQGNLDVYRVKFSDGISVECSADHLWSTMSLNQKRSGKYSVRTTQEILKTVRDKYNRKFHRIPLTAPVEFRPQRVEVDPYVLGVILGDGNCHRKTSVTITNVQEGVLREVASRLPVGLRLVVCSEGGIQYRVSGKRNRGNSIRSYLAECGLLGSRSFEKSIPDLYLYNSIEVRLAILRGLMDTDGSIFKHRSGNCRVQYYSTSHRLAEAVRFLVHSLGGTASLRRREFEEGCDRKIRHCRPVYVVDMVIGINPFLCAEKASKFSPMVPVRLISEIKHVGTKKCQCIKVAAIDSLYLTEHCVVTHNTFDNAVCIFDEAQNATKAQLKLFMTRFGENSKIIITGDPLQSDLRRDDQGLMHVVSKLEDLPGVGVIYFKASSIVRHPLIAAILEKLEAKEPERS